MAKGRWLRNYIRSAKLDRVSAEAETLFIRLMLVADDYGCFDGEPNLIRAACYPMKVDVLSEDAVQRWLAELIAVEVVVPYSEGSTVNKLFTQNHKRFIWIPNFKQRLDKGPKRHFPAPSRELVNRYEARIKFPGQKREKSGDNRNRNRKPEPEHELPVIPEGATGGARPARAIDPPPEVAVSGLGNGRQFPAPVSGGNGAIRGIAAVLVADIWTALGRPHPTTLTHGTPEFQRAQSDYTDLTRNIAPALARLEPRVRQHAIDQARQCRTARRPLGALKARLRKERLLE